MHSAPVPLRIAGVCPEECGTAVAALGCCSLLLLPLEAIENVLEAALLCLELPHLPTDTITTIVIIVTTTHSQGLRHRTP